MNEQNFESGEHDVELLVDTLRKCFGSEKARYYVNNNTLIVQLAGLEDHSEAETAEVAEPVFEELDMGFDEIVLLPLK